MNEIVVIEKLNPVEIYSGGLDSVLEKLAHEAKSVLADISTEKGRKEIASNAYKVARSKTLLDDMGKKLGEEAKAKLDAINADRKKARDFCDSLKDEVRKPLTEWENADKERIAGHEKAVSEIEASCLFGIEPTTDDIESRLSIVSAIDTTMFQEFTERAKAAKKTAIDALETKLNLSRERDAEAAELAALRAAKAETDRLEAIRLQAEREEAMKREAAENARREAEEKAAAAAKEAEARAAAELAAQKAAEEKAKREAAEAQERARRAEEARIATEEQAKADAEAAAERAEREKQSAVEAERKRAEAEKNAEAEAAAAREANKKHRAKINNEILAALAALDCVLGEIPAKAIVIAIAEGKIPHVKINY